MSKIHSIPTIGFAPRTWTWYSITTIHVKRISKITLSLYYSRTTDPRTNIFKNISNRRGRNPYDKDGNHMRCSICESTNHFVQNCPDRQDQDVMPPQVLPEKQEKTLNFRKKFCYSNLSLTIPPS